MKTLEKRLMMLERKASKINDNEKLELEMTAIFDKLATQLSDSELERLIDNPILDNGYDLAKKYLSESEYQDYKRFSELCLERLKSLPIEIIESYYDSETALEMTKAAKDDNWELYLEIASRN